MKTVRFILIAFSVIVVTSKSKAQDLNYAIWAQVGLEFDVANNLDLAITEIVKQDIEFPGVHSLNTDIELKYKLAKKWSAFVDYRLKLLPTETIHRFGASINFREGMGAFDLYFRSKFQYEIREYRIPDKAWRNRIKMRYELTKDIFPYVSYELFLNSTYKETNFNTYRIEIGSTYELNKHNDIQFYAMIDQELYQDKPISYLIGGISYQYKF